MSRERGRRRWDVGSRYIVGPEDNPMLVRRRLVQTPWFGLYLHRIYREDLDRTPHDHPWWFGSLILRGGYVEEYHPDVRRIASVGYAPVQKEYRAGRIRRFPLTAAHRIVGVLPGTLTLVLVGPKVRVWGFYDDAGSWTDYREADAMRPVEGVYG